MGGPGKIGCESDASCIIVAIGGAYTDATDLAVLACLGHQLDYSLCKFPDDNVCIGIVIGLDDTLCEHFAACIDDAELAALAAYVYTYYEIFTHDLVYFNIGVDILGACECIIY